VSLQVIDDGNATSSPATAAVAITETPTFNVVINEVAWAGTKTNPTDEWIELYNNSSSTIDIAKWTLGAADGVPSVVFSTSTGTTTIPAGGFYLLERSNDQTVSDVPTDYFFTGALNNEGERLELRDIQNNLIDLVDFSAGWPAGSSTPNYISMERISATTTGTNSFNWASNNLITRNGKDAGGKNINGTPRAKNSVSISPTIISSLPFGEFSEITLTKLSNPYIIQNNLTVLATGTLKIEPGVALKFNPFIKMEVFGRLKAIGGAEEEDKIIFTANSDYPSPDFWQKLAFSSSTGSRLENIIFQYGTIYIEGGDILIINSQFKNNKTAIEIKNGNPQIKNNIFEENETPILLSINASSTFSGNIAQNNNINGILSDFGDIIGNTVWQSDSNFPFVIDFGKGIGFGATLTLKEGTVVKIKRNSAGWPGFIEVYGRLITEGTLAKPVVITSFSDDEFGGDTNNDGTSTSAGSGSWRTLRFRSTSTSSILDGAVIRYGDGGCAIGSCWGAITQLSGVGIEIKNSIIEKNVWGIFSNESNCPAALEKIKIENTIFRGNNKNIYLWDWSECAP